MFCWKKMPPTHKTKSISYKSNSGLKFHIPSLKIKPFTSIIQNFSTLSCIFEDIIHFLNIHCKSRKKKKIFKTNVPKTPERRPIGFAQRQRGTVGLIQVLHLSSLSSHHVQFFEQQFEWNANHMRDAHSKSTYYQGMALLLQDTTITAGILQSSNQKKLEISNATYPTIPSFKDDLTSKQDLVWQ